LDGLFTFSFLLFPSYFSPGGFDTSRLMRTRAGHSATAGVTTNLYLMKLNLLSVVESRDPLRFALCSLCFLSAGITDNNKSPMLVGLVYFLHFLLFLLTFDFLLLTFYPPPGETSLAESDRLFGV
jgi:hypothetical protein